MLTIKVDSAKIDSGLYGVCSSCIKKALKLPENKNKEKLGAGGYIEGECDICHGIKPVVSVKDFEYPVFEIRVGLREWIAYQDKKLTHI